jgi:two-component system sensor histidine kinase YesM
MNMRQKEPVRLALDIETEALLVRVPRFILQPIVENALIHGLNRKAGTIRIAAAPAGGALRLTVEDDGCGMDKDRLESLNRKLNGPAAGDSARFAKEGGPGAGGASAGGEFSGFGLLNVVERMKMLCGDEFRMEVQSRPGEGTAVCLTIPYREGEHHV